MALARFDIPINGKHTHMSSTRRDVGRGLAAIATALQATSSFSSVQAQGQPPPTTPDHDMTAFPAHWHGKEQIAFLIYPEFTALDMVGPHYMLGNLMGATTHIVAKTRAPVLSDMKLGILPTATFEDCPKDLDIICVPGGSLGTLAAMKDDDTIAFLKDRGSRAKFVTSVCTGSLLLGAAGLLRGYKATSHWVTRDLLKVFGAEPVNARVVTDRNRMTGGGVTAGLDFGLSLVARLRDDNYAKAMQLLAEYQPSPPFDSGTPERADPATTSMTSAMFVSFLAEAQKVAEAAMKRL